MFDIRFPSELIMWLMFGLLSLGAGIYFTYEYKKRNHKIGCLMGVLAILGGILMLTGFLGYVFLV